MVVVNIEIIFIMFAKIWHANNTMDGGFIITPIAVKTLMFSYLTFPRPSTTQKGKYIIYVKLPYVDKFEMGSASMMDMTMFHKRNKNHRMRCGE